MGLTISASTKLFLINLIELDLAKHSSSSQNLFAIIFISGLTLINSFTLRSAISPPPITNTDFFLRFKNIGKFSIIKCYSNNLYIYIFNRFPEKKLYLLTLKKN